MDYTGQAGPQVGPVVSCEVDRLHRDKTVWNIVIIWHYDNEGSYSANYITWKLEVFDQIAVGVMNRPSVSQACGPMTCYPSEAAL